MSAVEAVQARTELPSGTWKLDPIHSTIGFAVKHNVIATFRGAFADVDGGLGPDGLVGSARVASVDVDEPNLNGHLQSPDFFDAERHPELRFASRSIHVDGDAIAVDGELTIKGITKPVKLAGSITGPIDDAFGGTRLGIELETTVDRREFELNWNAPLPQGGFAVANDVTIRGELELTREP